MPAPSKITDAEWQMHKATIRRLYMVENRKLDFVMREMSSTHGFSASKYQYTTRLNKWDMKKNTECETWSSISGALKRRCMDVSEANVFLNDQLVPHKKLKKELQRYTAQEDALTVTTPEGITIQPILEHIRKRRCVTPGSLSISLLWHALIDSWSMNWSSTNASPGTLSAQSSVQIDSSDWTWPSPKSYNANFSHGMSSYARGGNSEPPILVDIGIPDLLGPKANEIVGCFGLGTLRLGREKENLKQHLRRFLIEGKPGETQSAINDLMDPYSIASMKLLTAYMALMLSNDLVPDDGVQAFLVKAEELHCLGNLTPIFSQASPSARAFSTQLLHAAVRMNNTKFLRHALKYGANVESPSTGERSSTLLQEALKRGQHEAARLLIDARANVNAGSSTTYRSKACERNWQHAKGILCDCEREASDHTVALAAKSKACVSLIPELLRKGASISKRDPILIHAIEAGASTECITYLINAGVDINLCTVPLYKVSTPLSVAAQRGNLEIVQALLKAGANANGPLQSELSLVCADASFLNEAYVPLLCAIKETKISAEDCFNVVRLLLQYGADPNVSAWEVLERKQGAALSPDHLQGYRHYDDDPRLSYPLQAAVYSGNMELVMLLLQHKASTNSSYGTPALALAILRSNAEMVYLLLEHGADPNGLSKQPCCQSALEAAVDKKNLVAFDLLLQFGADINNGPAPYGGRTPLQRAAENGDERIIAYLLEQGASILSQSAPFWGVSVLQGFVCNRLHRYISEAIKAGACLNQGPSIYGTSPLAAAVIHNDAVSLELLLDAGANIEQYACIDCGDEHKGRSRSMLFYSRVSHFSPIQWAARMNHVKIARMLCEVGADVNQTAHIQNGCTALFLAIERENYEIAKFLLEQNAEVGAYSNGETALHEAIMTCNISLVDLLLENSADPNQACTEVELDLHTPLDQACAYGELSVVRSLLCAGADTSRGYAVHTFTEAYEAGESDSTLEVLEMLLQYGADVNKRYFSRHTALQEAILKEDFLCVDRLIQAGAYINAPAANGKGGRTALQAAVEVGNVDIVERLLLENADVNAPAAADHGVTALQAAAIKGYLNVAKVLLEHGAVIDAAASPKNGRTAINGAAEFGRIDMVKLLLDNYHGPIPISELCDDACEAAKKENQWFVMELLDAYEHPDEIAMRSWHLLPRDFPFEVQAGTVWEWENCAELENGAW